MPYLLLSNKFMRSKFNGDYILGFNRSNISSKVLKSKHSVSKQINGDFLFEKYFYQLDLTPKFNKFSNYLKRPILFV